MTEGIGTLHSGRPTGWARSVSKHSLFHLCLVLVAYGALLLPTVRRQGISWDEQTDIHIARSYLGGGWFVGSRIDPSQTRLPMVAVAIVYALLGTDSLLIGRIVSILVGALTLVGVYVYCKRDYDQQRGLLACALLATSPFFLSFARVAFTETDIYVACAFAWLLVCMSFLREKGTVGWALAVALALGLAISSKFTAVTVLPAVAIEILTHSSDRHHSPQRVPGRDQIVGAILVLLATTSTVCTLLVVRATRPTRGTAPLLYIQPFLWWVALLAWAVRRRHQAVEPRAGTLAVIALALLTFVLLPPVHTTNPAILDALVDRFEGEMGLNLSLMVEAAALHIGCILFKSSPLIGLGLLAAPIAAAFQWRERRVLWFPLLLLVCYLAGLTILPIAQTFYAVPLLPILAVLGADRFLGLLSQKKALAIAVGCLAAVLLAIDIAQCYPDYNLNGYQYLGSRYLVGRSSIGYRSVVQTPSDGVEQLARWLARNVKPGERVVACVNPWHIVDAVAPDRSFALNDVRKQGIRTRPDYVVVHINCEIRHGWGQDNPQGNVYQPPYDKAWLEANYTKIATVPRAFGLEVASIWAR